MCIHPRVMEEGDRDTVDSLCRFEPKLILFLEWNLWRNMTASWVRNRANTSSSTNSASESPALCQYYESFEREGNDADIPLGVYDLDQLKELGRQRGWCPYFLTRRVCFIIQSLDPPDLRLTGNQSSKHHCLQLSVHARPKSEQSCLSGAWAREHRRVWWSSQYWQCLHWGFVGYNWQTWSW